MTIIAFHWLKIKENFGYFRSRKQMALYNFRGSRRPLFAHNLLAPRLVSRYGIRCQVAICALNSARLRRPEMTCPQQLVLMAIVKAYNYDCATGLWTARLRCSLPMCLSSKSWHHSSRHSQRCLQLSMCWIKRLAFGHNCPRKMQQFASGSTACHFRRLPSRTKAFIEAADQWVMLCCT